MALTTEEKLILSLVLIVVMTLVVYYELRVMRGKARTVKAANLRKDEAHNAILTTRSVIDVVERDGTDVGSARLVFNRARDAMARGDYDRATELCESARIELMKCRQPAEVRVRKQAAPAGSVDDLEKLAEEIVKSDRRPSSSDSYKGTKLPVNESSGHLSARFEITAAKEDLGVASERGRDIGKAKSLLDMAESEFEAGISTRTRYFCHLSCLVQPGPCHTKRQVFRKRFINQHFQTFISELLPPLFYWRQRLSRRKGTG